MVEDLAEIELGLDLTSGRKFWRPVLLLAAIDNATGVTFRSPFADDCLLLTIEGVAYELVPPPAEFRRHLHNVALDLIAGKGIPGFVKRIASRWLNLAVHGRVVTKHKQEHVVWSAEWSKDGASFVRRFMA
jgi:hypothetical protein